MAEALIQSTLGEWSCSTDFSNGKKYIVKFEKKDDFIARVPDVLEYKDDFGKVKVHNENYAQHLLDSYPFLKLLKVIEKPVFSQAPIIAPKGQDAQVKPTEPVVIAAPVQEPVWKKLGRPPKVKEEGVLK